MKCKIILLILIMLIADTALAENKCLGSMAKPFVHTRLATKGNYCTSFTVRFPWRTCVARVCWRGSRDYPRYVIGTACGIRIACARQGRSNRYQCRYL